MRTTVRRAGNGFQPGTSPDRWPKALDSYERVVLSAWPATPRRGNRFTGHARIVLSNKENRMSVKKAAAVGAAVVGIAAMGAGSAMASAGAEAAAVGSPGVLSGNVVQVPIHIPVNACGLSVNVIGLLNPAFGNTCINNDTHVGG
jgi:hypothetical protein